MSKQSKRKKRGKAQSIWRFQGDGIWDIYFGLSAAWIAIIVFFHLSAWIIAGILPLSLIPYALKKWLTAPRASLLKLANAQRRARLEMGLLMLVIFIVILWLLKNEPGISGAAHYIGQNIGVMTGVLFAMISFYLAYSLVFPRLYFHGILVCVAFLVDSWLMTDKPFGFGIWAGLIIFFSGIYLLVIFLRSNRLTQ